MVLTSGKVVSSCGTSLGSYLPDSQVSRGDLAMQIGQGTEGM